MNPKPSKDLALNSGAYVLHALSDVENAQFEKLLAESEETRAEVTELADTAVELGLSVAPVDPPASLRVSILDAIANAPQLAPLTASDLSDSGDHELAPVAPAIGTAPIVNLAEERARRRWYTRPVTTLVAAAAAVALVFGGGVAINTVIQGQQVTASASQINQIQAAADYQRRTVDVSSGGSATVIWSVAQRRSALLGTGLTKLPSSLTYELWYIRANGATPAGTFDADGSTTQSVVLAGKMNAGDSIGVTIEPAGGSKKPTTSPIAVVTTA
ncbi:MAG: anti-sigma factor [Actinomycetota bacterium]|nr:anti-sigma factor [Actinomycetota bacterium]